MNAAANTLERWDWQAITSQLDSEGYALLPGLLASMRSLTQNAATQRQESLASEVLGRGQLCYYDADLPAPLDALRQALYPHLAGIANRWNERLRTAERYPLNWQAFLKQNQVAQQTQALSHWSQLGEGDYLALHQRANGALVFPLQLVGLLSRPGQDFHGGEFVMTEQRPRMQSRPMVLPLQCTDAALICTAQRPVHGSNGEYRVNTKHAISRVRSGIRIGLELSFHHGPADTVSDLFGTAV